MKADHTIWPAECCGREAELKSMHALLATGGAGRLLFLHGLQGIGKSTLLRAFAHLHARTYRSLCMLDAAEMEASETALSEALAAAGAGSPAQPALLIIDHYDQLHPLDGWMRTALKSWLDAGAHIILAGRCPPLSAWRLASHWSQRLRVLELGALDKTSAAAFLAAQGVATHLLTKVLQLTQGLPLAMRLAAAALRANPAGPLPEDDILQLIDSLAADSMAAVGDVMLQEALRRRSLLRRVTLPMLGHLVPEADACLLFEQLAQMPFVQRTEDGLNVQATLRQMLRQRFRRRDPEAFHAARRSLAQRILEEAELRGMVLSWRHTADLIYLSEDPVIRAMYFDESAASHFVEPALQADADIMIAIAGRHGGPRHAELTALWWREAPHCFHVARSAARRVEGFYIAATEMDVTETLVREDKALGETYRHVWECPPGADESWMLLRMRYCAEHGVDMSPANAVLCLDVKRGYVKHRQRLLRLYSSLDAASDFWPTLRKVGMVRLAGFDHHIDARRHFLTLLNFGPRLLNGWLASLLEIDMAPAPQDAIAIDESSRHLLLERERVPLSPLELRLMRYFLRHKGQALDRDTLLRDVWGRHYESSSNVVDVVVRALRKKLGRHGACIETVTRFGYRFQLPAG